MGCDPEFMVLDHNDHVINCNISHNGPHGNIGSDHGGRVGEMRPAPGTPAQVTQNLKQLFLYVKEHHPHLKIVCGGGGAFHEATGGHIHFGLPSGSRDWDNWWGPRYGHSGRRQSRGPIQNDQQRLVYALDYFIGLRLKKVNGGKRSSGGYGQPGDVRSQPHGIEYRTPPSWITDPILSEAVLAVAYQIAKTWQVKPTAFDELITAKKIARKREYAMLVPEGTERAYYATQIANFKRIVFSKTYKMDTLECVRLWTEPGAIQRTVEATTTRKSRTSEHIQLQICQLKSISRDGDFEQETVLRVCRFAFPEIRVYPLADYTPWTLQLMRDVRLRPNTIYISKELRPYLRIPRGGTYRVRFIEIRRRQIRNTDVQVSELTNSVFYNRSRSNPALQDEIIRIFTECIRKKIRRDVEA
jgi:hypothetical protein